MWTGNLRCGSSVGDPYGAGSDADLYVDCGDARAAPRPSRGDVTGCCSGPLPATSSARHCAHHPQAVFLHGHPLDEWPQPRGKHVLYWLNHSPSDALSVQVNCISPYHPHQLREDLHNLAQAVVAAVTLPETSVPSATAEAAKTAAGNQSCPEVAADSRARGEDFPGEVDWEEVRRSEVGEAASCDRGAENRDSMLIRIRQESWVFVRCCCELGWS